MKPDWDKLAGVFNTAGSRALIADVDCTADSGKFVCHKYGVSGYPTIKYFTNASGTDGEKYDGSRDYNALKTFVEKMSKDPCVLATLENCDKKEKAFIEEMKAWDDVKASSELAAYQSNVDDARKQHQDVADKFETQKNTAVATEKESEEAKKEFHAFSKANKFRMNILEQKTGAKKQEL